MPSEGVLTWVERSRWARLSASRRDEATVRQSAACRLERGLPLVSTWTLEPA